MSMQDWMPSTVRTKLIVIMITLVGIISLGVFIYFPTKLRAQALKAVEEKAESIAEMTAFSVAPALVFDDKSAGDEALAGARQNRDLEYLVVYDIEGRLFSAFGHEEALRSNFLEAHEGQISHDHTLYQTSRAIRHEGREIGRLYLGLSLKPVALQIRQSRTTVALVALIIFVVAAIAITTMSSIVTLPLRRIVDTVEKIAAGDTTRRADVQTDDEIGELARSFNVMVDHLDQARGELQQLNRDLERRVAERTRELSASESRYRLLFERNLAGVYRTSIDGRIIDCNDACARIFGFESRDEFVRGHASDLFFDVMQRQELMARLRRERILPNMELHLRRRDGTSVWILESMSLLEGDEVIEGTVIDITDRKEAERQIEHQAYHDALTGLPNRALFTDRLGIALARARRAEKFTAVMFLDLDRFKFVNDTFGHSAGDLLLQRVAERLRASVREEDTVARIGGDEFTLLLSDLSLPADAAKIAQKLVDALGESFHIQEHEFYVTPSIGVALYPTDGTDSETLLKNADNAMYRAKEMGRNNYQLASEAINRRAAVRLSLETSLRRALERQEFVVHYQPQINVETWQLAGVEALVRWDHPTRGLLLPAEFIELAEETKLIARIDEMVMREACCTAQSWERAGVRVGRLSVNVSASQLHSRELLGMIERTFEETGFEPARLEIEITESTAMQNAEATIALLTRLRELGVRISIDDFGMGHSALHYLHRFPIDTIKIDKSFVQRLTTDPRSGAIVSAIVTMARTLGLSVIAEGVETQEQLTFLKQKECTEIQGHLFSKAISAGAFVELAMRQQPFRPAQLGLR